MKGDDQILACPNWLSGLSRADGDMGFMGIRVVGDSLYLTIGEGKSEIVGRNPVTRGDIRKLCSAFGIELREEIYRG